MATLTVAPGIRGVGVDLTGAACAGGGDAFANTGQEIVSIKNASGAPITVSFTVQAKVDGLTVTALAVSVAAGQVLSMGPFPQGTYNDPNGLVQMTYSGVTSLTAKVLRVTPA